MKKFVIRYHDNYVRELNPITGTLYLVSDIKFAKTFDTAIDIYDYINKIRVIHEVLYTNRPMNLIIELKSLT